MADEILRTLRIDAKNIKKNFKIYYDKGGTLKEKMLFWKRNRYEIRTVLNDISFKVHDGEVIGLIGRNGCGKSTLLKMITGIYFCNGGRIDTYGRISSLIELGAGFHPDMSGRENIYINAAIFGLTKKEIDARLKDIIEFSELEDFIDQPVRTYSSGMYMRLAFSVAINVDANILLIDEILAVGDASFQKKCFNKLNELKAKGVTIVIVTHDINTIRSFCNRVIWINDGKIAFDGDVKEGSDKYLDYLEDLDAKKLLDSGDQQNLSALSAIKRKEIEEKEAAERQERERLEQERVKQEQERLAAEREKQRIEEYEHWKHSGNSKGKITTCHLLDSNGRKSLKFNTGEQMTIHIEYELYEDINGCCVGIGFNQPDMVVVYGTNTRIDDYPISSKKGKYNINFNIESLPLVEGTYLLNVTIIDEKYENIDFYNDYLRFKVRKTTGSIGLLTLEHTWSKK